MRYANADNWLKSAAKRGDIGDMRAAIAGGAKKIGNALFGCAKEGQAEATAYLADRCSGDKRALNHALVAAARYGHVECMEALLGAGADPSGRKCEAFRDAVSHSHPEAVQLLLDHGVNTKRLPPDILQDAICPAYNYRKRLQHEVTRILLENGIGDISLPIDEFSLCCNVHDADFALWELLAKNGFDFKPCGEALMQEAVERDRIELVELLNLYGFSEEGSVLGLKLVQACEKGDLQAVKDCVDKGADINFDNSRAIERASYIEDEDIALLLIERKIDLSDYRLQNIIGTFLHYKKVKSFKALVKNGYDLSALRTRILREAIDNGLDSIADWALQSGADPNGTEEPTEQEPFFDWPMKACVERGNLDMAQKLLDFGASLEHPLYDFRVYTGENWRNSRDFDYNAIYWEEFKKCVSEPTTS